ncbi:hypothetical protein Hanom_Chr03g00241001 [Helianthus anomalus]
MHKLDFEIFCCEFMVYDSLWCRLYLQFEVFFGSKLIGGGSNLWFLFYFLCF